MIACLDLAFPIGWRLRAHALDKARSDRINDLH
jgi:hypothetical protein